MRGNAILTRVVDIDTHGTVGRCEFHLQSAIRQRNAVTCKALRPERRLDIRQVDTAVRTA